MSLITLNSSGERPEYFSNYLPQPIIIKPYSQVCLMKFLHFRDGGIYNITTLNQTFYYVIGTLASVPSSANSSFRRVVIPVGQYTGDELAALIKVEMDAVNQQQNYAFTCTFQEADPTTSPPTKANFTISYISVPKPGAAGLKFRVVPFQEDGVLVETDPSRTLIESSTTGIPATGTQYTLVSDNGIRTHLGEYLFQGVALDPAKFDLTTPADSTAACSHYQYGIVRDLLSVVSAADGDPNKSFNPSKQDVQIVLGGGSFGSTADSINVLSIVGNAGQIFGSPSYVSPVIQRSLPLTTIVKALLTDSTKIEQWAAFRMRFKITTSQTSVGRCICQMGYSTDSGVSYNDVPAATGGTDPATTKAWFVDFTDPTSQIAFPGTFWISGIQDYQNQNVGVRAQLIKPKRAPYHPTAHTRGITSYSYCPDLADEDMVYQTSTGSTPASADITIGDYTGAINGYAFTVSVAGGKTYYLMPSMNPKGQALSVFTSSAVEFYVSEADVEPTAGNTGRAVYSYNTTNVGGFTITEQGGAVVVVEETTNQLTKMINYDQAVGGKPSKILVSGVKNGSDNPAFANFKIQGSSRVWTDEDVYTRIAASLPADDRTGDESIHTAVGPDLESQITLWVGQLDAEDIGNPAFTGAPTYIGANQIDGDISGSLGLKDNVYVGAKGTTGLLAKSEIETQRVSRDNVLMVSIPELSGLKSYQGIDRSAGKHLSGEAKVLAILPREEFAQGESSNGHLVYVAPFENWLDINNAQELVLNQMTVEVRILSGELAEDLTPISTAQIKFREDPTRKQVEAQRELLDVLRGASDNTGQILSKNVRITGS
mgnify:CR=1 FL=1